MLQYFLCHPAFLCRVQCVTDTLLAHQILREAGSKTYYSYYYLLLLITLCFHPPADPGFKFVRQTGVLM